MLYLRGLEVDELKEEDMSVYGLEKNYLIPPT